LKFQFRVR